MLGICAAAKGDRRLIEGSSKALLRFIEGSLKEEREKESKTDRNDFIYISFMSFF